MPIVHFDAVDGLSAPDAKGTALPVIDAALAEAIRLSGEILRDRGAAFWNGIEGRLHVADPSGRMLFTLGFAAEEHAA